MPKLFFKFSNLSFLSVLLVVLLVFFSAGSSTKAFFDDFTSDPRSNANWIVQNSSGLIVDSPGITLTSSQSGSFPYLKTSVTNSLALDKYYEIKFQFIETGSPWGVGGSFTDNAPNFPTYLGSVSDYLKYNIAYFFGEKLHSVTSLCPINSATCPSNWWFIYPNLEPQNSYDVNTLPDYLPHTFSMVRTDQGSGLYKYNIFLDSKLIFVSKDTNRLVNSVWLGHPSDLGGLKDWPILKVFSDKQPTTSRSGFC